jgi:hypothetical protein
MSDKAATHRHIAMRKVDGGFPVSEEEENGRK